MHMCHIVNIIPFPVPQLVGVHLSDFFIQNLPRPRSACHGRPGTCLINIFESCRNEGNHLARSGLDCDDVAFSLVQYLQRIESSTKVICN